MGELTIKTPERRHSVLQFQSLSFLNSQSEVQAAKLVISHQHNTTGPGFLFSIIIQTRLYNSVLWNFYYAGSSNMGALAFCDLDCSSYKSLSFRIGAGSLAAENGLSDTQIRGLGRWK